jgi:hypothetical protein
MSKKSRMPERGMWRTLAAMNGSAWKGCVMVAQARDAGAAVTSRQLLAAGTVPDFKLTALRGWFALPP